MIMAVSLRLMLSRSLPVALGTGALGTGALGAVALTTGALATVALSVVSLAGCGNASSEARNSVPPEPAQTSQPLAAKPSPPAPNAAPQKTDTRPIIAAFGDSLSAGFGVAPGKSYPDDLQRLLDAAGYRYHVMNFGVSGDTTTDGVERLPEVLAVHPAIVILEFGGNDGLRGQPVASAEQNMAQMIVALEKGDARILLAGMTLPRNYGPEYIHSFEQMYVSLSKQYKIERMPFLLEGVGGHPDLTQPDGIHPTAEGARIVADNVLKYLRPLITKNGGPR